MYAYTIEMEICYLTEITKTNKAKKFLTVCRFVTKKSGHSINIEVR